MAWSQEVLYGIYVAQYSEMRLMDKDSNLFVPVTETARATGRELLVESELLKGYNFRRLKIKAPVPFEFVVAPPIQDGSLPLQRFMDALRSRERLGYVLICGEEQRILQVYDFDGNKNQIFGNLMHDFRRVAGE